jgi:hypothetical protein
MSVQVQVQCMFYTSVCDQAQPLDVARIRAASRQRDSQRQCQGGNGGDRLTVYEAPPYCRSTAEVMSSVMRALFTAEHLAAFMASSVLTAFLLRQTSNLALLLHAEHYCFVPASNGCTWPPAITPVGSGVSGKVRRGTRAVCATSVNGCTLGRQRILPSWTWTIQKP